MEIVKTLIANAKIAIALASAIFFTYGWFPEISILPVVGAILLPFGLLIAFISAAISLLEKFKLPAQSEHRKLATHSLIFHGLSILLFLLYGFWGFIDFKKHSNGERYRSFSPFAFRVAEVKTLGDSNGPPVTVNIGYGFIPFTSWMSMLNTEVFHENCYGRVETNWNGINELSISATHCSDSRQSIEKVDDIIVTIVTESSNLR